MKLVIIIVALALTLSISCKRVDTNTLKIMNIIEENMQFQHRHRKHAINLLFSHKLMKLRLIDEIEEMLSARNMKLLTTNFKDSL